MDELSDLMRALDAERPMPADVRERLERTLLHPAEMREAPMPAEVRARLVATMSAHDLLEDLGGRPMPSGVRARLERSLVQRRRNRTWARGLAAAAVVAMMAITGILVRGGAPAGDFAAPLPTTAPPALPDVPTLEPIAPGPAPLPGVSAPIEGGVADAPGSPTMDRGPAPPYMDGPVDYAPSLVVPDGSRPGVIPPQPPLRVGVVRGDPGMEQTFDRYVRLLNERGGLLHRRLETVTVSPDSPAPAGVVVSVNLSGRVVTTGGPPGWTRGPVLEGLDATEDLMAGTVFSTASPPERQAHLLADAVYPAPVSAPTTAVIYRSATEPFATVVPRAIESALDARGVAVVTVSVREGAPTVFVPADVAFLSMETARAAEWLDEAADRDYRTTRGVAGIYSLVDGSLLPRFEEGRVVIVSPYGGLPDPTMAGEPIGGTRGTLLARIHGWVTAKDLAVAIWRAGSASTPSEVRAALRTALRGYASGFAPAFEFRAGTNARTPEGIIVGVRNDAFESIGSFRRDPR